MRVHILALLVLAASAGAVVAEQSNFAPITDAVQISDATEKVRRDKARALKSFGDVDLKQASVADVDANKDGRISFEELLRFDAKSF